MSYAKSERLEVEEVKIIEDNVLDLEVNARKSSTDSTISLSRSELSNTAENELINLDDVELSDGEDTWLYTSPKNLTKEEKGVSPYKWLRKDVEDPTNHQLQMVKTALVSKLDELDILASVQNTKLSPKIPSVCFEEMKNDVISDVDFISDQSTIETPMSLVKEEPESGIMSSVLSESEPKFISDVCETEKIRLKDVSDVLEKARLQEESLKLSSSKFFNEAARTFPRGTRLKSSACSPCTNLIKPASVEALYAYNGQQSQTVSSSINTAQKKKQISSPSQSPFGSSASLNFTQDVHRSSLPNLNKGYHSLKLKKSKRTSEPRIHCPLPIYPKTETMTGSVRSETTQMYMPKTINQSSTSIYGESQTLPSSYRIKSKKNSLNKLELPISSLRRESSPISLCQRSNCMIRPPRRESSPIVAQQSPRKSNGMRNLHGGSMPVLQNSQNLRANQLPSDITSGHRRNESIMLSPTKRQPLSSVHNYTSKQEDFHTVHNRDLRKSSLPSKIPSPSIRSGIPVPSAQYSIDRTSPTDESWSQDFY